MNVCVCSRVHVCIYMWVCVRVCSDLIDTVKSLGKAVKIPTLTGCVPLTEVLASNMAFPSFHSNWLSLSGFVYLPQNFLCCLWLADFHINFLWSCQLKLILIWCRLELLELLESVGQCGEWTCVWGRLAGITKSFSAMLLTWSRGHACALLGYSIYYILYIYSLYSIYVSYTTVCNI